MKGILRRLCEAVADHLPSREINGLDGSRYLTKYRLLGTKHGGAHLHLHRFHRSDEDSALHNHPWSGASLILVGGYDEESLNQHGRIVRHPCRPGDVNIIAASTVHRVELVDGECWTLFLNLPVIQPWGFVDRHTREFTPAPEFFRQKFRAAPPPGASGG